MLETILSLALSLGVAVAPISQVQHLLTPTTLAAYNSATNVLYLPEVRDPVTTQHELIHFLQDLKDGLGNSSVELLNPNWDCEKEMPELWAEIKVAYFHAPEHWRTECEAFLLQDAPDSVLELALEFAGE